MYNASIVSCFIEKSLLARVTHKKKQTDGEREIFFFVNNFTEFRSIQENALVICYMRIFLFFARAHFFLIVLFDACKYANFAFQCAFGFICSRCNHTNRLEYNVKKAHLNDAQSHTHTIDNDSWYHHMCCPATFQATWFIHIMN